MWKFILSAIAICTSTVAMAGDQEIDKALKSLLRYSVPIYQTAQLAELISDPEIVILDSREKDEFEVSHLPNSLWVGYDDFSLENVSHIPRNRRVIVYCSIGLRSEKIAERLRSAGFKDVHNLYGGIFAWANEKRSILDVNQQPTNTVHGYNRKWATLLEGHVNTPQRK